jgi:photosystem II stability/assembly factor-like uncharacterized protein
MKFFLILIIIILFSKITDAEDNYQQINTPIKQNLCCMQLKKDSIGNIYSLCADTYYGNTKLFRSTDNGQNWSQIYLKDKLRSIDIGLHNNLFVTTYNNQSIYNLLISNDQGNSWNSINPKDIDTSFYEIEFKIQISENELVCLFNSRKESIFYKSNDLGKTWIKLPELEYNVNNIKYIGSKNWFVNKIGDVIVLGDSYVFTSKDSCASWFEGEYQDSLSYTRDGSNIIQNKDGIYYIVTYDKLYCSTDEGYIWSIINKNNLNLRKDSYLNIDNNNNEIFITCYQPYWPDTSYGLYKYDLNDNSFAKIQKVPDSLLINVIVNKEKVLCGTMNHGVQSSSDNFNTWNSKNQGINFYKIIRDIYIKNNDLYIATDEGIYHSNDDGKNWNQLNDGLSDINTNCLIEYDNKLLTGTANGIYYLQNNIWKSFGFGLSTDLMILNSEGELFASSGSRLFYYLPESVLKWNDISGTFFDVIGSMGFDSLGNQYIGTYDNHINGNDPKLWISKNYWSVILNACSNAIAIDKNNILYSICSDNLYISSDFGQNWKFVNFFQRYLTDILIDNDEKIIIGTIKGIIYSVNDLNKWYYSGLENEYIKQIKVNNSNQIYVSTRDNGLFAGKIFVDVKDLSNVIYNQYIRITFDNKNNELNIFFDDDINPHDNCFIKIYDLFGNELKSLELNDSNKNHINFDLSFLQSGIYFCTFNLGHYYESKKFVIIR